MACFIHGDMIGAERAHLLYVRRKTNAMAYIMVVDDDEAMAFGVAAFLRNAGHEVRAEHDTKSAAISMEKRRPDLVILDVMFDSDSTAGFRLARRMHLHGKKTKDTPILMLTAINRRYDLGFSSVDIDEDWLPVADFVEKPVLPEVLRSKVSSLLCSAAQSAP